MTKQTEYYIEWRIEISADNPEAAARQALAIQRDGSSCANVFHVTDEQGETVQIDLEEIDQEIEE